MLKSNYFFGKMLLLICLFSNQIAYTQSQRDSLKRLVNYWEEDDSLVFKLVEIGHKNILINNLFSAQCAEEAYEIAKKINFSKGIASALNLRGILAHISGNHSEALLKLDQSILIYREINDTMGSARVHCNLGAVYNSMGNVDKSIEALLHSLDLFKKTTDTLATSEISANVGTLFCEINNWEIANNYYQEAWKLVANNNAEELRVLILRAGICNGLGNTYLQLGQLDSAKLVLKNARSIIDDPAIYPVTYAQTSIFLGDLYFNENNLDLAISEHKKAEKLLQQSDFNSRLQDVLCRLAKDYLEQERTDSAKYYLYQVINMPEPDQLELLLANQLMTSAYIHENKADSADFFFEQSIQLKEKIMAEEKLEKIQELEMQYESERLKADMTQAKYEMERAKSISERQKLWLVIVVMIAVALVLIGLLVYRQHQRKKEQDIANLEQQLLKARMNPHFIFNCLSSIQFLYAKDEKDKANDYMADFATLIRKTLDYTSGEKITIDEEIELLKLYLEMEKLRVNDAFEYEINTADNLIPEYHLIPPMLIQPLVENAIWHGVLPTQKKGKISICFSHVKNSIHCSVKDNGVGFSPDKMGEDSKAMKLIEKRIGQKIKITHLTPGTAVEIMI